MKPSERIQEIAKEHGLVPGDSVPMWAVIAYLDEEYERNKKRHDNPIAEALSQFKEGTGF